MLSLCRLLSVFPSVSPAAIFLPCICLHSYLPVSLCLYLSACLPAFLFASLTLCPRMHNILTTLSLAASLPAYLAHRLSPCQFHIFITRKIEASCLTTCLPSSFSSCLSPFLSACGPILLTCLPAFLPTSLSTCLLAYLLTTCHTQCRGLSPLWNSPDFPSPCQTVFLLSCQACCLRLSKFMLVIFSLLDGCCLVLSCYVCVGHVRLSNVWSLLAPVSYDTTSLPHSVSTPLFFLIFNLIFLAAPHSLFCLSVCGCLPVTLHMSLFLSLSLSSF